MQADVTLWRFIADAGPVVKIVMLILIAASVASWTFIFQRVKFLNHARKALKLFETEFWSGAELEELFKRMARDPSRIGLANIFHAGLEEFNRLQHKPSVSANALIEGAERAMRVALAREQEQLEQHLSFLATVGSTSPYIGLFGTVWGIMTAFQGLANVQQATISMVAPGISEALIATAIGLFAAIPAVIAYNRFSHQVERLLGQYETFQEEFTSILHRQIYAKVA